MPYLAIGACGSDFEQLASAKYQIEHLLIGPLLAFDVLVMGKTQRNYVVLRDVDKGWGKWGVPFGMIYNFKG